MKTHPTSGEVCNDAVEVDPKSHRDTLRRWRALTSSALLVLAAGACGGGDDGPSRSYTFGLRADDSVPTEYKYVALDPIDIRAGDEVTFEFENTGTLIHDLVIVDPDGNTIAQADPVSPGASTSLVATFDEAGFYRLRCLVDDHLTVHNMQTAFEVTDAES